MVASTQATDKKLNNLGWDMKHFILSMLIINSSAFAETHEHRHHEAHVHGSATLNIAFEKLQGRIEFKSAAVDIVGFEHAATSVKHKKTLSEAIRTFENDISKMVLTESQLGCTISKEKIEMVADTDGQDKKTDKKIHSQHVDFVANYNVICKKEIVGSKIILDFTNFPNLKDLDVTLLADNIQKTAEIKGKQTIIDVK